MPRPHPETVGKTFGRLTVKAELLDRHVACTCTCGRVHVVHTRHLLAGRTQSCGCLHSERTSAATTKRSTRHGKFGSPIYAVWNSMLGRCHNPKAKAYKHYGARGITVSPEWHEFKNFYADMGDPPPDMTLDRENNDLGYSKTNCRWATHKEQANNKRSNVLLTRNEKTQNISQWAEELGIDKFLLYERKNLGWSDERILTTPKRHKAKHGVP